uniref:Uncharacterized protein n=1 Tax=Cacopsylla melanoneura TaxID=428564 RepID=A0A8D9EQW9_9HEMI
MGPSAMARRYLASSHTRLHLIRSVASSIVRLIVYMSFSTSSHHLFFGLPLCLLPSGLFFHMLLTFDVSSFLITCPIHLSLPLFTSDTISGWLYNSLISLLCLILQIPSSSVGPYIFLKTLFSKVTILFSVFFVMIQDVPATVLKYIIF